MSFKAVPYLYFPHTIAAGGIVKIVVGKGNYVQLLSNTAAINTLFIAFDGGQESAFPVGQVLKLDPDETFEYVIVRNADSVSAAIVMTIGNGNISNTAFTVANVVTTNSTPTSIVTPAAISAITGAPGTPYTPNSTCRELQVYNNDAANTVWYGDANVAATRGIPILPGEKVIISCSGVINFRAVGGAVTLSIAELRGA